MRCFLTVALLCAATAPAAALEADGLSAADFVRLIRDFSEAGGYFLSDNFTSSEDSYLTIVDKMKELGATGGAYIGVGPEQNFTYIAKVRPRIAFIVDIRRQAMIQHLMYKAIFQLSPTRADFLSRLLSRPMSSAKAPGAQAPLDEILEFFAGIKADEKTYSENLAAILRTLQEDLQFPLSTEDRESLEYVYRHFLLMINVGLTAACGRPAVSGACEPANTSAKRDLNGKRAFSRRHRRLRICAGKQRRKLLFRMWEFRRQKGSCVCGGLAPRTQTDRYRV
jgi:hypothetical protein